MKRHGLGLALRVALSLGVVLPGSACRVGAPETPLADIDAEIADLEAWLKRHPKDVEARQRLAQLYWFFRSDYAAARPHLEYLEREFADPLASFELGWGAYLRMDDATAWGHFERVAQQGGRAGALLEPSLRRMADIASRNPIYDAAIETLTTKSGLLETATATDWSGPAADRLLEMYASVRRSEAASRGDTDPTQPYLAQGCVSQWGLGPVEGHLGPMGLTNAGVGEALTAADDELVSLRCAVRVWNPEMHPGIRRLRTRVQVDASPLQLGIEGEQPLRVFVDGTRVHASDSTDRWPTRSPRYSVEVEPGPHVIEVQTTVADERAWFSLRARDGEGRPLEGEATTAAPAPGSEPRSIARVSNDPLETPRSEGRRTKAHAQTQAKAKAGAAFELPPGPAFEPLATLIALEDAIDEGDSDRGERLRRRIKELAWPSAELAWLSAQFEEADPSRARVNSAAREQAALELALERDASLARARLELWELQLARGEAAEVLAELDALEAMDAGDPARTGRDSLEYELIRVAAYRAQSNELMADEALAEAARLAPRACSVLSLQRAIAQERGWVAEADAVLDAMRHCAGSTGRGGARAHERGDFEAARASFQRLVDRAPDDLNARGALAELAVTQRDYATARDQFTKILERAPWRSSTRVALADVLIQLGDLEGAKRQIERVLERSAASGRVWEVAARLGIPDPLMAERVDGMAFVEAFRPDAGIYEGAAEVLVLDRDVAWVYPDGSQRHLVHQIAQLRSKGALDNYGELELPEGAEVLTLHTIKPDGRVVEPESIAGKGGVSLRSLEVGDLVEMEYVLGSSLEKGMPGYVDVSSFKFQDFSTPYHHSEFVVVHPADMKIVVEARNAAPTETQTQMDREGQGPLTRRTFLAREVPRKEPEPGMRSWLSVLPTVRVATPLSIEDWLGNLESGLRIAQRSNPELRAKVAELTRDVEGDRAKLEALWSWVVANVQETSSAVYPATATLADREGSALMLLRAMLNEAGIRSELWLTRDRFGPEDIEPQSPLVSAYDTPMLAVYVTEGNDPLMVMTNAKTIPLGYLTPGYAKAPAYRLRLRDADAPAGPVATPDVPAGLGERRHYELEVTIDATGSGRVKGSVELSGIEALLWRNELSRIDESQLPERFAAAELPRLFGYTALDLDGLRVEGSDDLDAPLRFEFEAHGPGLAPSQGGTLALPLASTTVNLAGDYAALAQRTTDLVVPFAPQTHLSVEYRFEGIRVAAAQGNATETHPRASFERSVEAHADGQGLSVTVDSSLQPGIYAPEEYATLLEYATRVNAAEQAVLRLDPKR